MIDDIAQMFSSQKRATINSQHSLLLLSGASARARSGSQGDLGTFELRKNKNTVDVVRVPFLIPPLDDEEH